MSSVEEYNIDELFQTLLHPKVIEWDLFITRLKKSTPVPDSELKEMWSRNQDIRDEIHNVYVLIKPTIVKLSTIAQWCPLKYLSKKLSRDIDEIYENFTEEVDTNEAHSNSTNLAVTSHEEQSPSQAIADTEAAAQVKHPDEDNSKFLDAGSQAKKPRKKRKKMHLTDSNRLLKQTPSQAKKPRKKRKKEHQGMCPLKTTPRPAKINKSLTMKVLTRRKMILIPNRVRNLLNPAPQETVEADYPAYSSKPVPGGASSLLRVRPRTSSGSKHQSRVTQANVNSQSSHGMDEAVSVPNTFYTEDHSYYNSFPAMTDMYSAESTQVPEKTLISVQRLITLVWKQLLGQVGAVFKSSGYQLSDIILSKLLTAKQECPAVFV